MDRIEYGTVPEKWDYKEKYGNHRFLVSAPRAEYVRVVLPWRRHDGFPDKTGVIVRYGGGAVGVNEVKDVLVEKAGKDSATVVFRAPVEGIYELYYLPFELKGHWCSPETHYLTRDGMTPSEEWLEGMNGAEIARGETLKYESRTEFDSFYPMEFAMTAEERNGFMPEGTPFALVTESRLRPVRMKHDLPGIWVERAGDRLELSDTVCKNEHYAFQVAVCAAEELRDVKVTFRDRDGKEYGKDRCFSINTYGIDTAGREMELVCNVQAGDVLPLWCCVDIETFAENEITLFAEVTAANTGYSETAEIRLSVADETLPRNGDDDLWRMSRLFWLNSTVGISGDVIPPYTPVNVNREDGIVSILGRRIVPGENCLPCRIETFYDDSGQLTKRDDPASLLKRPVSFTVRKNGASLPAAESEKEYDSPGTMLTKVRSVSRLDGIKLSSEVSCEADGFIDCRITAEAERDGEYDFSLSCVLDGRLARYMMGMCREGGPVPPFWEYRWNEERDGNVVWLGGPRAGLQIRLMQDDDHWGGVRPIPESWSGGGRGRMTVRRTSCGDAEFYASSGKREMKAGESICFHFHMIVTPLHPVDLKTHFTKRYYQSNSWHSDEPVVSLERAAAHGASTVILHQGGPLNENINYPFHLAPKLKEEVDRAHKMGMEYKIYYTVRELSNYTAEIWALRSLGDEIYYAGTDFRLADFFASDEDKVKDRPSGGPWLIEHLGEGFCPAWHQPLSSGEYDCAIRTQHRSRWHNYYLKGLEWLMTVVGIDGLYLDGIGYNRHITRRLRRVMQSVKDDGDIDIHVGNEHAPFYGYRTATCDYLEHFAYADKVWIGEGYDYETRQPEYFLTEVSGLCQGLTSEMLEKGGNPWRGALFGMTTRAGWSQGGLTLPIWKLWDGFGIADARMYGFWDPDCPVSVENDAVKATAFVKKNGEALIAVASWLPDDRELLISVDREALGIDGDYELYAPPVEGFQDEAVFPSGAPVPIACGKGRMFLVRKK